MQQIHPINVLRLEAERAADEAQAQITPDQFDQAITEIMNWLLFTACGCLVVAVTFFILGFFFGDCCGPSCFHCLYCAHG